jgi:IS5 family transposase
MFKIFVLQQCHGLSDFELEKHCIDRISFRKFLGFSDHILDKPTVWSSRKRTIGNCKEEEIWAQLKKKKYGHSCKANLIVLV